MSTTEIRRADVGQGVELAYEAFGDPGDLPVMLVMGLGTQMLAWPDGLVDALVARGLWVVRFDNRDVGLSTHLHDAGTPDVMAVAGGDTSSAPYRLTDMARDTVGLLDALGLGRAHLVGASMGGMIAQTVAIEHPERVLSLTSIMSTTGDRAVGAPSQEALAVLFSPAARSREEAIERTVQGVRVIGSPGFETDEDAMRARAAESYDRAFDPAGVARHLAAVMASEDRTPALRRLDVPALVIHGAADKLVDPSGGRATAGALPSAELVMIDGMGHDLPAGVWNQLADRIAGLVRSAA